MIQFKNGYYADIRVEDRSRTVISYKAGALEEIQNRREKQAFLRVYDGKLWYYASTTDTGSLQETLDRLYAAAAENPDILKDPVVRRFEKNRDRLFTFADCSVRKIPLAEKQKLLLSYLPLLPEDSCVVLPMGTYLDRSSIFHFMSSLGADVEYDYQTCGLSFDFSMTEGEKQFQGSWQKGGTGFDEMTGIGVELREAGSRRRSCAIPCRRRPGSIP